MNILFEQSEWPHDSVCAARHWESLLFLNARTTRGYKGRAGEGIACDSLYHAGETLAHELFSALVYELGSFSYVEKIVQYTVYVASVGEYADMSKAANGFSAVLTGVFGERGRHARAAMGCERLEGGALKRRSF